MLPGSLELFGVDAAFGSLLLLERVEGDMAQDGEILTSLVLAHPAVVFVESHIQDPVQIIFDRPVSARDVWNSLASGGRLEM